MKGSEIKALKTEALEMLGRAGIVLTPKEQENMEIAELGLGDFKRTGLGLVVYENNDKYCVKELILWPRQTCPEHWHPPVGDSPGKMETFRCRWGTCFVYVEGEPTQRIGARMPEGSEPYYTVRHEIELNPGQQYTVPPNTKHWFQAGDEGAIVSEFSTTSHDKFDQFTDPRIDRLPQIAED